jgi:hypothetical protein
VPILDDERFKSYLKEFRPLAPEQLRLERSASPVRRPFVLTAWAGACVAVLLVTFLVSQRFKPGQPADGNSGLAVGPNGMTQTLTIGRANALLSHSPSFKEAVDELSFQPHAAPQSEGKQSALAVLSEENIKL